MTVLAEQSAPTLTRQLARRRDSHITARVVAAALLVAVSYVHLADQNFLAFDKSPSYLLMAYVIVEIAAPLAALAVLKHPALGSWLLTAGCAAGPLAGFVLTRTVGLPNATEDIGNWGEPLGIASLIVEGTLLLLAATEVLRLWVERRSRG